MYTEELALFNRPSKVIMPTARELQDAAYVFVDVSAGKAILVGIYESDDGRWINVYYRDRAEKIAYEQDVFGRVLIPDEVIDGYIELHNRQCVM